jgi:hypothetical protein
MIAADVRVNPDGSAGWHRPQRQGATRLVSDEDLQTRSAPRVIVALGPAYPGSPQSGIAAGSING